MLSLHLKKLPSMRCQTVLAQIQLIHPNDHHHCTSVYDRQSKDTSSIKLSAVRPSENSSQRS
uniref:Uncharacterized protein n=1 Tax=Arundo donax TaxID=35708 RepID=A0A0A9ERU6_ARUDO